MRLNKRIIDGNYFHLAVLDAIVVRSAIALPYLLRRAKTMAGHIRISEDDPANPTKAVDSNKGFRHSCIRYK